MTDIEKKEPMTLREFNELIEKLVNRYTVDDTMRQMSKKCMEMLNKIEEVLKDE